MQYSTSIQNIYRLQNRTQTEQNIGLLNHFYKVFVVRKRMTPLSLMKKRWSRPNVDISKWKIYIFLRVVIHCNLLLS
jgi:hypothetical protein